MSAAAELQAALVAALRAAPGLAGVADVYDGPPPDARLPYVVLGDGLAVDWSTKTTRGREHRVTVTAWDEAGRIGRLHAMAAAVEAAFAALPAMLANHRIASVLLVRSRVLRPATGPWAGQVEHRVRTVEI